MNYFSTNFLFAFVLCNKLCLNVFTCFGIFVFALIFRKTFSILSNENKNDLFGFLFKKKTKKIDPNLKLDRVIFSANKSFLFKNKMIDVLTNHLLLQIESNKRRDSCIRFVVSSSTRTFSLMKRKRKRKEFYVWFIFLIWINEFIFTWSYSLNATMNIIAVTSSKQWIHFFRSDRWPPTSKTRKFKSFQIEK